MMDRPPNPDAALAAAGAEVTVFRPVRQRGRAIGRLRLYSAAEAASLPARDYLLPGLIAPGEFSVWWGAPKCGKSFLLLYLAFCLALGRCAWGRQPPRRIRVLYATAEGEAGFGKRVLALREALGDPGDAFAFIAQRMTLGPPSEHLKDLIAAAEFHRAELIIVDTLARTFGEGDENHSGDMGRFISAMDQLREEGRKEGAPKPHVAVVHHGSKDTEARMPRGSIALVGGADLVVKVARGKEGAPNAATVEWAKDDEEGLALPFRLRKAEVSGASTCLVEEADEAEGGATRGVVAPPLSEGATKALRYLGDLLVRQGATLPIAPMFPRHSDLRCAPFEAWRDECRGRSLSGSGEKSAENRAFQRAVKALTGSGHVATGEYGGQVLAWIAKGGAT